MTMDKHEMKILFIIPPYFHIRDYISQSPTSQQPVFTIPYGILSLAAYVKAYSKYDIQLEIMDLNLDASKFLNFTQDIEGAIQNLIKDRMLNFMPDIVGISALFNTCYNHLEFISASVKEINNDVLLVVGGGLATNLYHEILGNFKLIDACCYGEGEIPFCELVNSENRDEYLKYSSSWITHKSLIEGSIPKHAFIHNLDDIPFFDYDLIDLNNYMGRSLDKSYSQKSLREISIHTSRGCPFNCVYCANATVHGKKIRYMSVEKVIKEIERAVSVYHAEILLIEDDHFLGDKDRAKQILERVHDFNLKVEFPNGIAVYAIDDDIGDLLKEAGVTTISLAVESGSDFVLKNIINKPHRVVMIKPAVDILRKNGISVHAFIVTGLPGELEQHREETMQMIFDVGFDWVKFFLAIPIAGSRLYDICKENGYLINNNFSQHVTTKANITTPDMDPEYIEDKVYLMNLEANFVRNYNLMTGYFHKASLPFENIVGRYPDHAFAHYYLAKSYEGMGRKDELIENHKNIFQTIINTNSTWERYATHFELVTY
jgi:anaerobic magnesium-protoporphyrin IX monomethyl ester cyclase